MRIDWIDSAHIKPELCRKMLTMPAMNRATRWPVPTPPVWRSYATDIEPAPKTGMQKAPQRRGFLLRLMRFSCYGFR